MNFRKLSVVLIALSTIGLSSAAYADSDCSSGFYIGGQLGYGNVDYGNVVTDTFTEDFGDTPQALGLTVTKNVKESGFAGRVYGGYQINQYFGAEAGYTRFTNNTYKATATDSSGAMAAILDTSVKTQQIDILGKIGTPFGNSGFRADLKAGPVYVKSSGGSSSENNWDPAAGASFAYNFTQSFAMDVSYLHAFGSGSISSPNTDLATLGVSYLFA
jgi:hypothetical protein